MHANGQPGRVIHPIPFTGRAESFRPNIFDKELKGMVDEHVDIRFCKIFEWMLPTFGGKSFYECLVARMHNFMLHSIKGNRWKPNYYCPAYRTVIVADAAAHFLDANLCKVCGGIHQSVILG